MGRHRSHDHQIIDLDAQTEQVFGVWRALWQQRKDDAAGRPRQANRMRSDVIDRVIAADNDLGHLLRWAIDDAEAAPIVFTKYGEEQAAEWAAVQRLKAEWTRLHPPVRIAIEQEDTCRHGVLYSADCGACDAEF